jgi:hypothetical protein
MPVLQWFHVRRKATRSVWFLLLLVLCATVNLIAATSAATLTWYKFSKDFITQHYSSDSAIGKLASKNPQPAKNKHTISCGGNDGEIHIGLAANSLDWQHQPQTLSSAMADTNEEFGVVAEPVNMTTKTLQSIQELPGNETTFVGYFRTWNEGHDRATGNIPPSNPNHVIEVHPIWAFQSDAADFDSSASIAPMKGYAGYGASKLRPLLESVTQQKWLRVYEDDEYVYVQIAKQQNFYQLPVIIRGGPQPITGGISVAADVFSDAAHKNLIYKQLRVVSNDGSRIAGRLQNPARIKFLLGIFSVNLQVAMKAAQGHRNQNEAVFAPEALEFFAYGVPLETAVKSTSGGCVEETGD